MATDIKSWTKPLVGTGAVGTVAVGLETVGDIVVGVSVDTGTGAMVVRMGARVGALDTFCVGTGAVVVIFQMGAIDDIIGTAVTGATDVANGGDVVGGSVVIEDGGGTVGAAVVGTGGAMTQPDWEQSPNTTKVTVCSEPSNFKHV